MPDMTFTFTHHYWRNERFSGWGTQKGPSWQEAIPYGVSVPEYMQRAADRITCADPYRIYKDAVVVRSWVEDTGKKAIIHDGVLTVVTMQQLSDLRGEPIAKGIKKSESWS